MDGQPREIRYPFDRAPDFGDVTEVADGVLWARLPLPMALDHVNVFALDDGDGWTVVDTGFDTGKTRGIWETLLSGPLSGRPVRRVVVTHHHPDHIGLAGWFQTGHGAELVTTRTAWLFARMLALDVQERPTTEALTFYRAAGMPDAMLAKRQTERPFNFADILAPLPSGFTRLTDGQTFRAGGRSWHVRFGQGHAPDHATFWSKDDMLVLGGDQLLPSISPNLGVYPTEPEADPVRDWLESCRAFAHHARDGHFVLPGHKLPFTGLPTRLEQLIGNHVGALDRLEAFLATSRTATDCFPVIFKRQIGESEYSLALVEAMAHCLHLWHAGRATRERREDGAWLWRTTG